ncbi:MAG TPA: hypothetical protein VIU82_21950 [Bosea sp. (in: a-proteobacteria)]
MIVLKSTMEAALETERARHRCEMQSLVRQYGSALDRVSALQKTMSAWVRNAPGDITPNQMAQMFYAQDDRWQAAFFNCMQGEVRAHHDALPPNPSGWPTPCPGVPAGEAQWCHMAQHLDDSGRETIAAMHDHATYQARQPETLT